MQWLVSYSVSGVVEPFNQIHIEKIDDRFITRLCTLCISEDGIALFKTTASNIVVYNSNDGRLDFLRIWGNLWSYLESLVSP
ncbi:hypothetical protein JHK87_027258 [Glycine soja]|nr:hypothetical protein JHK87_027258 [Glycine soja]